MPLKQGVFTDTGYRMRKNVVEIDDNWFWSDPQQNLFYDFRPYNYDVFEVDHDFKFLATLYFRLDTSEILH